jgi:hypothetical protein
MIGTGLLIFSRFLAFEASLLSKHNCVPFLAWKVTPSAKPNTEVSMLEFLGILFLIGFTVIFFPLILAGIAIAFCFLMGALTWIKEQFTNDKS